MFKTKILPLLLFTLVPSFSSAATLTAIVKDKDGEPAEHSVIAVYPEKPATFPAPNKVAIMDQIERQYSPFVLAIQKGSFVEFPNWDKIKHHVYSFSRAKKFELKLYSGKSADPVQFDEAGPVVLGCNIHDWMLGYIYVVDTPYFSKTDSDGRVSIEDLPAGKYRVEAWNPGLRGKPSKFAQSINLQNDQHLAFNLPIKIVERKDPPPFEEDDYKK